ncbi:MAG: gliding motility-associated C-terminal domain-containing protein [Bacteroidota bacterium]
MKIYDRWGVLIFAVNADDLQALRPQNFWNGRYQQTGKPAANGTYQWIIQYTDSTKPKEAQELRGRVFLLR